MRAKEIVAAAETVARLEATALGPAGTELLRLCRRLIAEVTQVPESVDRKLLISKDSLERSRAATPSVAMKLVALDLSLTATGWATSDGLSGVLEPPKGKTSGWPRVQWVVDRVHQITEHADLTVIENYAFGAKGSALTGLHELGGIVRFALWEDGRRYVDIPPTSLKKFATGSGNAGKAEVIAAAIRKLAYAGHNDNEADAKWLLEMAVAQYGAGGSNESQRDALKKIQWPELAAVSV